MRRPGRASNRRPPRLLPSPPPPAVFILPYLAILWRSEGLTGGQIGVLAAVRPFICSVSGARAGWVGARLALGGRLAARGTRPACLLKVLASTSAVRRRPGLDPACLLTASRRLSPPAGQLLVGVADARRWHFAITLVTCGEGWEVWPCWQGAIAPL